MLTSDAMEGNCARGSGNQMLRGLIVSCVVALVLTGNLETPPAALRQPNFPKRTFYVHMRGAPLNAFLDAMRAFGNEHGFTAHVRQTKPTPEDYIVYLDREDIFVISLNSTEAGVGLRYRVSFYANHGVDVSRQMINALANQLSGDLSSIPGITRIDEEPSYSPERLQRR